jgi:cysteine-rich repeat protein
MRLSCIIVLLAVVPACGSRRVAGYLEDLDDCSTTASGTSETATSSGTSSSDDTTSSGSSGETTEASSEATGTSSTTDSTPSSSGSTETSESSTGEPIAECGNGVLEAFGLEPEECDDNNLDPDDGCSETCALDRRVFVTSVLYDGGAIGGLKSADARCANLADDQGWPEGLKYQAWLSDSKTDARDRFKRGRGRLVMANGLVFAASWSALLAGQLQNPLEVTEKSETYHGGVWTGTRPDGTAAPASEHCDDWTSSSFLKEGIYGDSSFTSAGWTDENMPGGCAADFALYCMQSL